MELKETSGHILEIGDKVKMNIKVIGEGDLDGVEFTTNGKNYWRYMNQHPDEIYTITGFDFSNDEETTYNLSGYMADNNWYSAELILVAKPTTIFEAIKSMTIEEMTEFLSGNFHVHKNLMQDWLSSSYKIEEQSNEK